MLKPVVHCDQRDFHESGLLIDGALQILQLNPPVPWFHHAKIECEPLLKGLEMQERTFKMQLICDDVSTGAGNIQSIDNQVFSGTCVGYEADLSLLRVNQ